MKKNRFKKARLLLGGILITGVPILYFGFFNSSSLTSNTSAKQENEVTLDTKPHDSATPKDGAIPSSNEHQQADFFYEDLSPEIQAEISRLSNNSLDGLEEVVDENGVSTIDLKGRFKHVPVAMIGPDGKILIKEITAPHKK